MQEKLEKQKNLKTRMRRVKDLDEIQDDIKMQRKIPVDPDLPGSGQFYCVTCSRHFITQDMKERHERSKWHKKRLKDTKAKQYTQDEADAAAGFGAPVKRRAKK